MTTPKKLLLLSSEFPPGPGGIGTHAYQLATHLSRFGWQVNVAAPQPYVTRQARELFNRQLPFAITTLEHDPSPLRQLYSRFIKLGRLSRRFQPDVILASGSRALWTAAFISRLLRIPWLAIAHGTELLSPLRVVSFLTHSSLRSATATVAVSDYTAGLLKEKTGRSSGIHVIPNGADGDLFNCRIDSSKLRRKLDLVGKRILLTVGRVSERKAQDVVIRALPTILRYHPDIAYVLVGLPEEQAAFQQIADQLGVSNRVHFSGAVAQETLPEYYNLCDIFVLTSRKAPSGDVEGYGIVVLEAALCGKPAVVSQSGGLSETVHAGRTGLVVPPDDPEATASALLSLLGDRDLYQQLSEHALCCAQQATWQHRVASYDQLLQELTLS